MNNIVQALMIVVGINSLIFLSQLSLVEINPESTIFFEYEGSDISQFDVSNGDYVLDQDVADDLPETGNPVAVDLGSNVFTDTFSTIKNWLLKQTGAKYVLMAVNAVPTYIKYFGLPSGIAFALGWMWHVIVFVFAVMFIKS